MSSEEKKSKSTGKKSTGKKSSGKKMSTTKRLTSSKRAGLVFPVGRIKRMLKKDALKNGRVSPGASVYLTAVIEYIVSEILELSGYYTRDTKKVRITPRAIFLSIRGDEELAKIFANTTFANSGVVPGISMELVKNKKKPSSKKE